MNYPTPDPTPDPNGPPEIAIEQALLLTALRRLVVRWRERASASHAAEAEVYHRAERDLTHAIEAHATDQAVWRAARVDLVRAIISALDERERSTHAH